MRIRESECDAGRPSRQNRVLTPTGVPYRTSGPQEVFKQEVFHMTSYLPQMELWEIDRLIPNPKNARKHSTEQIQELAASMSAFGFMSAVVAGSDGIVLAGN